MQHIYGYGQHLEIILNIAPRIYWLDNEASRLAITYKCAGLSGAIWEAHSREAMFFWEDNLQRAWKSRCVLLHF